MSNRSPWVGKNRHLRSRGRREEKAAVPAGKTLDPENIKVKQSIFEKGFRITLKIVGKTAQLSTGRRCATPSTMSARMAALRSVGELRSLFKGVSPCSRSAAAGCSRQERANRAWYDSLSALTVMPRPIQFSLQPGAAEPWPGAPPSRKKRLSFFCYHQRRQVFPPPH